MNFCAWLIDRVIDTLISDNVNQLPYFSNNIKILDDSDL